MSGEKRVFKLEESRVSIKHSSGRVGASKWSDIWVQRWSRLGVTQRLWGTKERAQWRGWGRHREPAWRTEKEKGDVLNSQRHPEAVCLGIELNSAAHKQGSKNIRAMLGLTDVLQWRQHVFHMKKRYYGTTEYDKVQTQSEQLTHHMMLDLPLISSEPRIPHLQSKAVWAFPGGPVVRTPCFHCWGSRFKPWSGY